MELAGGASEPVDAVVLACGARASATLLGSHSPPGLASIAFSKQVPIVLDPELPSLQLIVRPVGGAAPALPLIERANGRGLGIPLYLSEPAARLYGVEAGAPFPLPIGAAGTPARARPRCSSRSARRAASPR